MKKKLFAQIGEVNLFRVVTVLIVMLVGLSRALFYLVEPTGHQTLSSQSSVVVEGALICDSASQVAMEDSRLGYS